MKGFYHSTDIFLQLTADFPVHYLRPVVLEEILIMKWLGRVLVFVVTFALGLGLASVSAGVEEIADGSDISRIKMNSASIDTRTIHVSYAGWYKDGEGENDQYLKIRIYNGLLKPVAYSSHSADSPFPFVKVNGKEIDHMFRCGTGMKTFTIEPGQSVEFRVAHWDFTERPRAGDSIAVGFYLRPEGSTKYQVFYSDPFRVPEEFRATRLSR